MSWGIEVQVILSIFFIFLSAFVSKGYAYDLENYTTIECEDDIAAPLELKLTSQRESLYFVEFEFVSYPLVEKSSVCDAWLRGLKKQPWFSRSQLDYRRLSPSSQDHVRMQGILKKKVYTYCLESSRCSLKFPYNWHVPFVVIASKLTNKDRYIESQCFQQPKKTMKVKKDIEFIQNMKVDGYWVSPASTFTDQIKQIIDDSGDSSVMIASMITSASQVEKVSEYAKNKIEGYVYVMFDMNRVIDSQALYALQKSAGKNIILVPMSATPSNSGTFHVKGASDTEGKRFAFTTSNLRGLSHSTVLDLGVVGTKGKFSLELSRLLANLLVNNCHESSFLQCHLEQLYEPENPQRHLIQKLVFQSCLNMAEDESLIKLSEKPYEPRSIMYSREIDTEHLIARYLEIAKNEVVIAASFINKKSIVRKLNHLHKKGIRVRVISKEDKIDKLNPEIEFIQPQVMTVHSKMIIIDNQKILWSTANFTISGLTKSREILLFIEDPKQIQLAKKFLNSAMNVNSLSPYFDIQKTIAKSGLDNTFMVFGTPSKPHKKLKAISDNRQDFWKVDDPDCLKEKAKNLIFAKIADWERCN